MLRVSHRCLLMATTSPHPNASPSAVSPAPSPPPPPSTTITGSPPQSFFSPPLGTPATSPVPQSNANPPGPTTPSVPSPPTQSPLSTPSAPPPRPPLASPPPPLSSADPPSNSTSPPPTPISASPPISPPPRATPSSPTPPAQSSPPPVPSTLPTLGSPPPPLAQPIQRSPPPPSPTPPKRPPSPPSTSSPENSPPSVSPNPPLSSTPPPPSPKPPETSPPPPTLSQPPSNSPPPPASEASPKRSPPPPASEASPKRSPPSPTTAAPILKNAPLPPRVALPNPPASQPTPPLSNSTPKASFPSSVINLAPPPYSPFSPPSSVNDTIPSAPENSKSIGNGGIATGGMVAILVALSVVMISLIGFGVWCIRKQRKDVTGFNGGYAMPSPLGSSPRSDSIFTKTTARLMGSGSSSDFVYTPPDPGSLGNSRSWFTYEELLKATNGFSSQNLLGKGGFGCVYYGRLPDGREVAVKQLNNGGGQGEREFKAEVEIISRIHHRHLVSLVGYCITKKRRLLIYDYLPNNTLYFHLGGEGRPVLDWATRVKIAAGAARGIAYLHEDCHPRIIHRDVKSSNILLDKNFEAKVSDFGLAKLAFDSNTHITTRVMGTFGYVAPEYASSGKLTEKSDVFSYGVVLLELITGRKPVDPSQPVGDESLVEWARPLLSHVLDSKEFDALVDPRLEKNYVESEMFQMIEAAAACVRHSATKRPWMGQVVRAFDNLTTADITNGLRFGESEVVNSAQQSAEIRLFQRMAFGSQNYSPKFFSQGSSSSQG